MFIFEFLKLIVLLFLLVMLIILLLFLSVEILKLYWSLKKEGEAFKGILMLTPLVGVAGLVLSVYSAWIIVGILLGGI